MSAYPGARTAYVHYRDRRTLDETYEPDFIWASSRSGPLVMSGAVSAVPSSLTASSREGLGAQQRRAVLAIESAPASLCDQGALHIENAVEVDSEEVDELYGYALQRVRANAPSPDGVLQRCRSTMASLRGRRRTVI